MDQSTTLCSWGEGPSDGLSQQRQVHKSSRTANESMTVISDSQIVVALLSALVTGILALGLGKALYR
jgi:photosystem I reaction center subunit XII